jgi:DNA adenine methylase
LGFLSSKTICKPFLKWAGGNTQLISELSKYVPASYNKYIKLFIGGGAFSFHLDPYPFKAIIADLNEELIITYKAVHSMSKKLSAL